MASDLRRPASRSRQNDESVPLELRNCLQGKDFLLEVENRQWRTKVAETIKNYGGEIVATFDDKTPMVVISDHSMASRLEKEKDLKNISERSLKLLPALLREAIKNKVKVRTPAVFLKNLANYTKSKQNAASANNSNSTMRGRPQISRERSAHVERTQNPVVPRTSRVSSDQSNKRTTNRDVKAFLRIDIPGKRPDIRLAERENFNTLYAGKDVGHYVFKVAEPALMERRERDFELFKKGAYLPAKKNFKLDDLDNQCNVCNRTITGDRKNHEKTDEHRQKVKNQGRIPAFERILMSAKLRTTQHEAYQKRKEQVALERKAIVDASQRGTVEYEYGENELKANWSTLRRNTLSSINDKPSPSEPSVRRRQKRIRYSPSIGDGPSP